jgi:hypothetical protein
VNAVATEPCSDDDDPERGGDRQLRVADQRDHLEAEPERGGQYRAAPVRQPAGVKADPGRDHVAGDEQQRGVDRREAAASRGRSEADPLGLAAGVGTALRGGIPVQPGESHLLSLTKGGFYASRD